MSASSTTHDLAVLFEHPEWQKPLFAALERRGISFLPVDLKAGAFAADEPPRARLYFNQASPSAYVRGNTRAVPFAFAYMQNLELQGVRVLNGTRAFSLELSKSAQAALIKKLGLLTPRSLVFNDPRALDRQLEGWAWPCLVKPEQGGSGARMIEVTSQGELVTMLDARPDLWLPDNLLLLQERIPYDASQGIVRLELLGGELLYAMRVVSHGAFNLCPSEVCHPVSGEPGVCAVPVPAAAAVEFHPYPEVDPAAVEGAKRIVRAGGLDVAGIEFIETPRGPVFYDVNANSNLRPAVARAFGFDPFERVVDFLEKQLAA